jgi:hypothetical protein
MTDLFQSQPPIIGQPKSPIVGIPFTEELQAPEPTEATEAEEEDASEPEPAEETEAEVDETIPSQFAEDFKKSFGIEPQEAVELVNSLSVFKDEMLLMREWGVDPGTYDSRMSQVREFYNTLPEEGKARYNSVDGARAIWEHIGKNQAVKTKTTVRPGGKSTTPPKPPVAFKKSEILAMSPADYARKLPQINKAWQEGRVIEDV